jgi:hypothetical protein
MDARQWLITQFERNFMGSIEIRKLLIIGES